MWKHDQDGDVLVRTTKYSLPVHLDGHIDLIQPTTAFHRAKGLRTTFRFARAPHSFAPGDKITIPGSGVTVDASCRGSITVECLKQLYNAVHYVPKAPTKNAIALTGYLNESANFADLQRFYADQVPHAMNTSFDVVLVGGVCCSLSSDDRFCDFWCKGGQNNQTRAGFEANLDVQFALGISFPTPGVFHSTGGSPPYVPDKGNLINTNEPYLTVCMQYTLRGSCLVNFRICVLVAGLHPCTKENPPDHFNKLW